VSDAPLTLGTAGHIDHGKTALIDALTGRDTDRLPEEKQRGISIELGYAPLELPSGRALSVIDVPGHERFVRTMVAGATGVDMFLLCIAADDGVMPQTREHMAVLRQLGVEHGVVAITKADLGGVERAAAEAAELVPEAAVVPVSVRAGTGLPELLARLDDVASGLPGRAGDAGPARLHVDRSFALKGIGTVVTGTLWAGSLAAGDTVRILPGGLSARVRSVQVHDQPVERAAAGQRVALNLAGVRWREVGRGDVVVLPEVEIAPTYLIDARVQLEPAARPLERGTRLHVHHGTSESPARVAPLGDGYVQLRLERPLVPVAGDRLVLRQIAPPDTIGGGVVVDPAPRKHGESPETVERLRALERGEPPPPREPPAESAPPRQVEPPPLDEAALRIAELLREDGARPRADGEIASAAGLTPSETAERLRQLVRAGRTVRVARNLHFDPAALSALEAQVVAICERDGQVTIAVVRDELGTSRRYAQALLEHLDGEKVTRRVGDAHVLRRAAAPRPS
jgi:selenocysteine-specific elongation factor